MFVWLGTFLRNLTHLPHNIDYLTWNTHKVLTLKIKKNLATVKCEFSHDRYADLRYAIR